VTHDCAHAFAHDALLYAGPESFLEGTLPFIREGLAADEAMLVAVPADRIALLRAALDGDADRVCLVDMTRLGRNPAAIISAWRDFLDDNDPRERPVRGIGEPIWAGRSAEEIVECQRHESLLNLAFDGGPAWQLICPYDTRALPEDVILEARRSHPFVREGGLRRESPEYVAPASVLGPEEDDLPAVPDRAQLLAFSREQMVAVRRLVSAYAREAGLDTERASDLVLAVSELASNSVLHGGGEGLLAIWLDAGSVVCEVRDGGRIADPLVGRARPSPDQRGGHGMWLVNALCDLVQLRSLADGSVVRLTLRPVER
jgi:anti-sigma regulatory factor (Ser/Thr protein kinase)